MVRYVITTHIPARTNSEAYDGITTFCRECFEAEVAATPLTANEFVIETDACVKCDHCPKRHSAHTRGRNP